MALSSPGVQVSVIDESFYTPAEPGTVPLIVVATAENKQNGGGTGTAPGTLVANDGTVWLLTSQKDLADTFGDPVFKTDSNNNPIHAGEQNEYGLQAAYSLLGVSNRAYVVRANVDLDQLTASATAPSANPANGTYWFDTQNTAFGIFEWNAAAANVGGQVFVKKTPIVITDTNKIDGYNTPGQLPKTSVGAIGDYAVDATATPVSVWYKTSTGAWVNVGSNDWQLSKPVVTSGTVTGQAGAITFNISNGTSSVSISTDSDWDLANLLTKLEASPVVALGIEAYNENNKIALYSNTGIVAFDGTVTNSGFTATTYRGIALAIDKHTSPPQWKSALTTSRPTGSVWIKTTEPNNGARWRVKRFNSGTELWESVESPIYADAAAAIYNLDRANGGSGLAVGTLFTKSNSTEAAQLEADFQIYRRKASGATTVTSKVIDDTTFDGNEGYAFTIKETTVGLDTVSESVQVTFTTAANSVGDGVANADIIAGAINSAGLTNVQASVDSQNRIVITHTKGGEMLFKNVSLGGPDDFLEASDLHIATNMYATAAGSADEYVASLWDPLAYTAGADAPNAVATNNTLWYSSVIDEIDIMIHDGDTWVGYLNELSLTDPAGPLVSATMPTLQSNADPLVTGDLWIDTSDIENFPTIYKYNADATTTAGYDSRKWILVDKTDQSTEDGVLFADARAGANGGSATAYPDSTIVELLESDFLDFDAPDPALYPKGMLLWNLRRSGFNVKKFVTNYVDLAADNSRGEAEGTSMSSYYPHRWVTESANQADGSGTFGRKAQRAVVVQALQATVNSNQDIRDDESRVFNLIACPGYPELIGELITLNYDRGLTAFVVGDTPARLTSDATSLLNWGNNTAGALEDNDIGATSFDEYMGMFYPWGFSSDNFGNNIAVPPSHMILRTIALNDQVAYPWFAPAGVRRGGITNATAVGYITGEGEFKSVALNTGQRDTLYESKINPITFLTGSGLVNYGQKTRARAASSLDRINVARLVCYLRRQLSALAKPYIFEPNDKVTRDQIKASVEGLMLELVGQRALFDYVVVCDESNNTPSRIDRNELWIDIAIEPVKAIEFIYIPLRLKNTGEIAALG